MGNEKIQLSWAWPLISYRWIPEILASINHAIEPSWSGLHREMTNYVVNTGIGNKIFLQLKTLLLESQLIQEQGKYILPTVQPTEKHVREYLSSFLSLSTPPWVLFYRRIMEEGISTLSFEELVQNPPRLWPEIARYPVFKQWTEFLQYLELGFLVDSKQFIPVGAVSSNMIQDTQFIDKCCKCLGDPRHLTGRDSLHTQADFLSWTSGESTLTVSADTELAPRIPVEHIAHVFESTPPTQRCHHSIKKGIAIWDKWITNHMKDYPFANLTTLIITVKTVLDFFLFGEEQFEPTDDIKKVVFNAKNKWESIPNFQISGNVWQVLPKLYQDIVRLTYGVKYYRNSLKKIDRPQDCIEIHFLTITKQELEKIKKIPIRCFRSKRSLHSILQTTSMIHTTLSRIEQKNSYTFLEDYIQNKFESVRFFLPSDPIDRQELMNDVDEIVELTDGDIRDIISIDYPVLFCKYQVPIIRLSYWAHLYYDIHNDHKLATIDNLQKKLTRIRNVKIKEIQHYKSNIDIWDKSFCAFQKQINHLIKKSREKSPTAA